MSLPTYEKHPSAIRAYPIYVDNLGINTIGVVSGAITPAGMTVTSVTAAGNIVTALLSSGVAGSTYQAEITINISNGERLIVEFLIRIVDN